MKVVRTTQIGLTEEFPYCIRDNNVYCSTLVENGNWERSPHEKNVKAFRRFEFANKYAKSKGLGIVHIVITYKEWEMECL